MALWWCAWFPFNTVVAAAVCVAGVALGHIGLHFAWQAWHTWSHRPSLCVAGVALGDIDLHFAWQEWHLWHWAGSGSALGSHLAPLSPRRFAWQVWHLVTSTFTLRGRRGTWSHPPLLCVAGVALGDIDLHFAWQTWYFWHWAGSGGALGSCLAPLSPRPFAWQVWHLVISTFTLHGRRGAWRHRPLLCMAGIALGDIYLHFAWQACHLWHWAGLVARLVPMAPLSQLRFAWQAWHWVTSTFTLHGRRGTWSHRPSLCVAGVALGDIDLHFDVAGVAIMALGGLFVTNHL